MIENNAIAKHILKSILFCIVFTGFFMAFSFFKTFIPNNYERWSHGIIGTLVGFLTTWLFLKFDKKRFRDIGLKWERATIGHFLKGLFAGIAIMGSLVAAVIYFSGNHIAINKESNALHFFIMTLPLIPLAFMEELGFRAYPLEIIKDKAGVRLSIIITSILFAVYHIANGWSVLDSFAGPAIWGLVFGLAAIYSKGIAMPTGIHYAANLTTSAFGAAGNTVSLWTISESGNKQESDLSNLLPDLAILVFAFICIEIFLRKRNPRQAGKFCNAFGSCNFVLKPLKKI